MKKKILILPISLLSIIIIGFIALKINGKTIAIVDKASPETTISKKNNDANEDIGQKTWSKIANAIPMEKSQTFTGQFVHSLSDQPIPFHIPVYGVYTLTDEDIEGVKAKVIGGMPISAGDIVLRLSVPIYAESPTGEYIEVDGFCAYVVLRVNDELGNLELPVSRYNTIVFNEKEKKFISISESAYGNLVVYTSAASTLGRTQENFPDHPVTVPYITAVENGYIDKATANYSLS